MTFRKSCDDFSRKKSNNNNNNNYHNMNIIIAIRMGLSFCFHILIPQWISCYNTKENLFLDTLAFLNPLYITINKGSIFRSIPSWFELKNNNNIELTRE